MDLLKVMQISVICAIGLLISALICMVLGISEGVFLFIIAFLAALLVIILWVVQHSGIPWRAPVQQPSREEAPQVETLEDLKMRYAKGEITTEQFRQMKKELGNSSS